MDDSAFLGGLTGPVLETERLVLRPWRDSDRGPWAALNADPEVMEQFPSTLQRAESDDRLDRFVAHHVAHGFGPLVVERRDVSGLLGVAGLEFAPTNLPISPCVEVLWRFARDAWGHGYATEAARAALADGFGRLGLREIVSFTATTNLRSQAVMQRLGMQHDQAADFDHPALPLGDRLSRHVVYRATGR